MSGSKPALLSSSANKAASQSPSCTRGACQGWSYLSGKQNVWPLIKPARDQRSEVPAPKQGGLCFSLRSADNITLPLLKLQRFSSLFFALVVAALQIIC